MKPSMLSEPACRFLCSEVPIFPVAAISSDQCKVTAQYHGFFSGGSWPPENGSTSTSMIPRLFLVFSGLQSSLDLDPCVPSETGKSCFLSLCIPSCKTLAASDLGNNVSITQLWKRQAWFDQRCLPQKIFLWLVWLTKSRPTEEYLWRARILQQTPGQTQHCSRRIDFSIARQR